MAIYGVQADINANQGKNVNLYTPGKTQLTPQDVFLGGTGTGVADSALNGATRVFGNDRQGTTLALNEYNNDLSSQIRAAKITSVTPRADANRGVATMARKSMETGQAQNAIDNPIKASEFTGRFNNAPTLAQKTFDQNVSQDIFSNGLAKQAQAIQNAQFNAKLDYDKYNSAADRAASGGISGGGGGPVSGNVNSWLQQALSVTGQDASVLPYLATIVQHESSGNPGAINNYDSNAKAGHPSKGLMQTIDSTFNQYSMAGHKDIWNPVDNAIAAINYAVARYGSLGNVPGIKSLANGGGYIGY
jgi:hypothetical protein